MTDIWVVWWIIWARFSQYNWYKIRNSSIVCLVIIDLSLQFQCDLLSLHSHKECFNVATKFQLIYVIAIFI